MIVSSKSMGRIKHKILQIQKVELHQLLVLIDQKAAKDQKVQKKRKVKNDI